MRDGVAVICNIHTDPYKHFGVYEMNNNATSQNLRPWFVITPVLIGALKQVFVNLSEGYRVEVSGEGLGPYFYKTS